MNTNDVFWWTGIQPQPFNFPIWAVLEDHSIYTVELLREPSALDWVKIKAWAPAQVPQAPMERWEALANEYFQRKVELNQDVWGARDWFIEGVRYGRDQVYIKADSYNSNDNAAREHACTQDEFRAKYGEYGEKYKPQTDPKTPWDPNWDVQ